MMMATDVTGEKRGRCMKRNSTRVKAFQGFYFLALLLLSTRSTAELPEGPGKALTQMVCTECHSTAYIERGQGYDSPEAWRYLIASMIDLPDAQATTISEYLATHFPSRPEKKPKLISGDFDIEITEWLVPTLGQRSRDPVEAPDGSIWWTGMWASLAGRLDPETGKMEEFQLPADARPHSILPDDQGNIWYMGNSNSTIGRLDPVSGDITIFPTTSKDPHTGVFHPNGMLYFTAQHAGMIGRLNPTTGELVEVATRARPYGIKVAQSGLLYVAHNGTNAIAEIDPETLAIRYFDIPDERTRIRRLDIASNGAIWFVNSSLGKIGRLNPETGAVTQWDSPSGPSSHPYAIAVIDDVVWYNESGMRPDALVRFDPATESFQSWAIPSGIGIVRHVWVTADKNLLIHQSSSNRIGLVKIPR
jgi:virginiamycin B lyase